MNHFILLPIALGSYDLYIMACRLVVAPAAPETASTSTYQRVDENRSSGTESTEHGSDTSWQRTKTGTPDDPVLGAEADEEE